MIGPDGRGYQALSRRVPQRETWLSPIIVSDAMDAEHLAITIVLVVYTGKSSIHEQPNVPSWGLGRIPMAMSMRVGAGQMVELARRERYEVRSAKSHH